MYTIHSSHGEMIREIIQKKLGISYETFDSLSLDEQIHLLEEYHERRRKKNKNMARVMIGSGENAIIVSLPRGKRYLLSDGTVAKAGRTPEKYRMEKEARLDEMAYGTPVAFVKKMKRKIKKYRSKYE